MLPSNVDRFNTKKGPQAIGPYSTVSIYGKVAYVSGQIGLDPKSG
jgi:enamine deaminase RidA (YjgF/YER057c/UK114 family)